MDNPSDRARTALIVFHGIGQQREFETLTTVAEALNAKAGSQAAVAAGLGPEDKNLISYATLTLNREKVDLFEAYWSPWTKGKVNILHVVRFLLAAGWRGLTIYFGHGRAFQRYLFGNSETMEIPIGTPLILFTLLVFIIALIGVSFAYLWVGVGYGLPFLGLRIFDQCLLRDLRTWLYFSTIVDGTLTILFAILSAIPARRHWVKVKGYVLYAVIALLMLVQIVAAAALGGSVQSHWTGHESRPSPLASSSCDGPAIDSALDRVLTMVGHRDILYPTGHEFTFAWLLLTIASVAVTLIYLVLPQIVTAALGDLVAYLIAYRASEFYSLREEIRRRCYSVCREVLNRRDEQGQPYYQHLIFVGHSLGAVIAYDTLNRILSEDQQTEQFERSWSRIRGLMTLGSPLNKAAFLFGYESGGAYDVRTRIYSCQQPLISSPELREQVPWINFWSRFDPVSASLSYFDSPKRRKGNVINIHDKRASVPIYAHVGYWRNSDLQELLQMMCCSNTYSIEQVRARANDIQKQKLLLLFSYGTLQNRNVQIANFSRELKGRPDVLPGYVRRMPAMADPDVVALSGEADHPNAEASSNPEDSVAGTAFDVTEIELTAADRYERAGGYRRISVTLRSGRQAWMYVKA